MPIASHFPGNVRIVEPPNSSQGDLAIINEENNGECHTREGVVHRSRDLDQEDKMRWIHIHRSEISILRPLVQGFRKHGYHES